MRSYVDFDTTINRPLDQLPTFKKSRVEIFLRDDKGNPVEGATVSVTSDDPKNPKKPRYLQLRRAGEDANALPFFELELNLPILRESEVTVQYPDGVNYYTSRCDNFVFEIKVNVR